MVTNECPKCNKFRRMDREPLCPVCTINQLEKESNMYEVTIRMKDRRVVKTVDSFQLRALRTIHGVDNVVLIMRGGESNGSQSGSKWGQASSVRRR